MLSTQRNLLALFQSPGAFCLACDRISAFPAISTQQTLCSKVFLLVLALMRCFYLSQCYSLCHADFSWVPVKTTTIQRPWTVMEWCQARNVKLNLIVWWSRCVLYVEHTCRERFATKPSIFSGLWNFSFHFAPISSAEALCWYLGPPLSQRLMKKLIKKMKLDATLDGDQQHD